MANVLFIDDDVQLATIVADLLRFEKHNVELAHAGLTGWEKASSNKFDLLILDWDLPELNGINILKRYRQSGGQAPVIMLTGHSSSSDKELGLDMGADDYLTKPFDPIELSARVRALLRRARPQAPVHQSLGSGNEELLKKFNLLGSSLASRYEFLELLGEGGHGIVFKVRHPVMEKLLAIKMLQGVALGAEGQERFKREAKAISRLEHPNIITIHDFGVSENGRPYMVMDFVEDMELRVLLKQNGALPPEFALDLAVQICDALAHAHSMKILHRDLKPGNIMLKCFIDKQPIPKLLDFGLAKISDVESQDEIDLTRPGQVLGSPPYMSPEQIEGNPTDERTDIYSLGCVLYSMLTGVPPHLGETSSKIFMKHLSSPVKPLQEVRPSLTFPNGLELVVQKVLENHLMIDIDQ